MDPGGGIMEGKGQAIWSEEILKKIQTGVVIIDPGTHTIVDVNPIAADMIGLPPEKIVGRVCHTFVCPAELGKCPITDLSLDVDNSERVLINGKGERINILKTVARVTIGGRPLLVESFIDITDRKVAENRKARLIAYMDESVQRVIKPLELIRADLGDLSVRAKEGEMETDDICMRLAVDQAHIEKITHTLRELLQGAVDEREDEKLPEAFREFLTGK
jgi:PAS domain S-box-containing protein